MSSPRVGNCIFCDDVRHELGGKQSLIGIYAADMVFPNPAPAMLPKFCCVAFVISDVDDRPKKLSLRVIAPSENSEKIELANVEVPTDAMPVANEEGAIKVTFRGIIEMGPVVVPHAGYFEVWADTEREKIRCGRLKIVFPAAEQDGKIEKKD